MIAPRSSRGWAFFWGSVLLILAGAVGGLLLFHLLIMPRFVRHGDEALVPGLRGTPGTELTQRLGDAGLRLGSTTRVYDDEVPMGRAVRQTPPAGARVKKGREVDVVISLGAAALRVPNLEGESVVHARFLLEQGGLREGRRRSVLTSERMAEAIVAANPHPGTPVRGRATVDLLVGAGPLPRRFLMPDLRGTSAEAAAAVLESWGLQVESRGGSGRGSAPVREQVPAPGAPVAVGDRVQLGTGR